MENIKSFGVQMVSELPAGLTWRKSTKSNPSGNCGEVAFLPNGSVALRHSRVPDGAALIFTPGEWNAFEAGMRDGEFRRG
jgi:Domain of unknown function (DUF397)